MEVIQKQVLRALRRLFFHSWLFWLNWALLACFSLCFIALLVPKIWHIDWNVPVHRDRWVWGWWIASSVIALIGASWISWLRRPSKLQAAVEIDRRYRLRERCSSALAIDHDQRQSPVGQALIEDAQKQVDRIDLRDQFPVRPAPQWAWVALPLAACIALFWIPDAQPSASQAMASSTAKKTTNIKNATEPILKVIQKKRQEAEEQGDLAAIDEYKRIEEQIKSLQNKPELDAKQAIADLNEIKKELQSKKESLGDSDQMKKALETLKDLDKGPAENMAKALQKGDFEEAKSEMEKIVEALNSGKMEPGQADQLQKQLEQMKDALEEAKQKREDLIQEAKNELKNAEKEGDVEKTASLRKKLEKLQEGEKMSQAAEKLQEKLDQAQKALKEGDKQAAAEAMQEIQDQLGELSEDQQAAEELEKMMEEIEDAKQSSKCQECDGQGCEECQGGKKPGDKSGKQGQSGGKQGGDKSGKKGDKKGSGQGDDEGDDQGEEGQKGKGKGKGKGKNENGQPGDGEGEGTGEGDRDEKEAGFKEYDAQVRDKMRKGEMVPGQKIGGKNRKGLTREEVRDAVKSATPDDPDAIENIELPKAQRDQLREYFDSLRGGK
jgi:chemotaxis protein histidine kinase CheA